MTDNILSPEDKARAEKIRTILLEVQPGTGTLGDYNAGQRRATIMDEAGFCQHCGCDMMRTDGTIGRCSCWNDE